MAIEGNGLTENATLAEGAIDGAYPISSGVPRSSFQKSDQFNLQPGVGADTYKQAGVIRGIATAVPQEIILGSSAPVKLKSLRAAAEDFTLTHLRYWAAWNYSDAARLLIWGGPNAPPEYPAAISVLPRTSANPGFLRAGSPSGPAVAIAAGTAIQVQSSAGDVEFLILLAGE